ncbi:MAG: LysM peptidoglycan-binding domain-containing protein [Chlamydiia bacterium]|nr:LysM peptidoglycan-binding domain-containing protein [Chlamydiia bacterium]
MSRRDTIIIAVLVNAGLLMVLFATAMHSDESKEESHSKGKERCLEVAAAPDIETLNSEDLLNEYVSAVPTLAESNQEIALTFEDEEEPIAETAPIVVVEEVKSVKTKSEERYANVTVKKGDFLEKIAKANNTTVAAIMKANKMSSTQLKIGQVLKVPLDHSKIPAKSPSPSRTSGAGEYYIVKDGDNAWLIASRNKINLEELLRLNGLDEQKAKRLRPGDKLKIR